MSVKNIVTNVSALTLKYGANYATIQAALPPLVAHDRANGIITTLYDVSSAIQMAKIGAPVVTDRTSSSQFKATFDAIIANTNPHSSMILGGADVVPFVPIVNPATDSDPIVPSDLPYACQAAYSVRAADFTAPSRVLTRLPDITGGTDANTLATLLRTPIGYQPVAPTVYTGTYLSPGVADWAAELQGALPTVFGNSTYLSLCPPNGPNWTSGQYQQQFHYINCHGGDNDPNFSGQKGSSYPVAMSSSLVSGRLTNGMGCVAACCYSAQLWNPAGGAALPMSNTYLMSNAVFYLGSSVICYGGAPPYNVPTNANMAASVFSNRVLAGDTIGEAMLKTWQALAVAYQSTTSLIVLKTLVEFMVFGDVTTVPVTITPPFATEPSGRADADRQRLRLLEDEARRLSRPTGAHRRMAEGDVPAQVRERIMTLVAQGGGAPGPLQAYEWVPAEAVRGSSPALTHQDHHVYLVPVRTSEASIYELDLMYEVFEADGRILSASAYPRR